MHLKGLGVSPGIGIGRALVLKRSTRELRFRVPQALVPRELERLELARARSREQIEQIKKRIADSAGADHVFRAPSEVALGILPAIYAALNASLPSYLEALTEEHGALDRRREVID